MVWALYYKIIPVIKKNKTYYTLLGWDGNDMFSNKKIIEILEFKKSKLQFGNSMFVYPNQRTKKRLYFNIISNLHVIKA